MAQVRVVLKRRFAIEEMPLHCFTHEEVLSWARRTWPARDIREARIRRAADGGESKAVLIWWDTRYPLTGAYRSGTVEA